MSCPGPGLSAAIISGHSDNQNQIRGGDIMMDPTNDPRHLVTCLMSLSNVEDDDSSLLVSPETG